MTSAFRFCAVFVILVNFLLSFTAFANTSCDLILSSPEKIGYFDIPDTKRLLFYTDQNSVLNAANLREGSRVLLNDGYTWVEVVKVERALEDVQSVQVPVQDLKLTKKSIQPTSKEIRSGVITAAFSAALLYGVDRLFQITPDQTSDPLIFGTAVLTLESVGPAVKRKVVEVYRSLRYPYIRVWVKVPDLHKE